LIHLLSWRDIHKYPLKLHKDVRTHAFTHTYKQEPTITKHVPADRQARTHINHNTDTPEQNGLSDFKCVGVSFRSTVILPSLIHVPHPLKRTPHQPDSCKSRNKRLTEKPDNSIFVMLQYV
jgi:hypothetical protein